MLRAMSALLLVLSPRAAAQSCPESSGSEAALHAHLQSCAPNRRIRPLVDSSSTVNARLNLWFFSINAIDELQGTFSMQVDISRFWNSELHVWDPSQYNGQRTSSLDAAEVWLPSIHLVNSATRPWNWNMDSDDVVFSSNGWGYTTNSAVLVAMCNLSHVHFPFDITECELRFESYEYHKASSS